MPTDFHSLDPQLQLGYLIHDVSRLKRTAFDRYIKELKATRSQWWVLAYVSRKDGMAQTQLAEQLGVGKVAIGGLIDRLERSGLATRVLDEEDRRIKRIFLTPKGQRLVGRLREASMYFNQRVLEGVSDADLDVTAQVLRKLKKNLINFLGPRAHRVRGEAHEEMSSATSVPAAPPEPTARVRARPRSAASAAPSRRPTG